MFESSQIKSRQTKNSKIKALKDGGWRIVSRGRKKGKDESDSWQNVCPDSLSAVADEYGCQLFRANCYSPSASKRQSTWLTARRGAPRRQRRSSFPRVVPPLPFFLPPSPPSWIIQPLENNCIPSTALIAPTQTHDWRQASWTGDDGWKESLANEASLSKLMYIRSGSRVCCLFYESLSRSFMVFQLLKPTHFFENRINHKFVIILIQLHGLIDQRKTTLF